VLLVAIQGSSRRVCAECISFSPCDALKQSSLVFVADVLEAGPPEAPISESQSRAAPQPARFKIVERFNGVSPDRKEIAVEVLS
jgi:hypothetical protein